ncbi:hypothetical protein Tco_0673339 [Tanacetum coccineum]
MLFFTIDDLIGITFKEASLDEERFLRQRLNAGDSNTAYFHKFIKSNCARNRIDVVRDADNVLYEGTYADYYRRSGPPRCAFKVDIQKAYDTVDWHSLDRCCLDLVFIIEWRSGLWQGDPLSPYLFTLVMEVLTLIIHRGVDNAEDFQGHLNSIHVIMQALEDFKNMSDLVPSIPKSTAFFCKVLSAVKASIPSSMPFTKGFLPVRYREVPLISSRLLYRDYKVLLEKLETHEGFSMVSRGNEKGKAKVAWESVCVPQKEGAFGMFLVWEIRVGDGKNYFKLDPVFVHLYGIRSSGKSTSMWFDKWTELCPIRSMLSIRDIVRSGFTLTYSVRDLISNGSWSWPPNWHHRFPLLVSISVPNVHNDLDDVVVWHDVRGSFRPFSVACA